MLTRRLSRPTGGGAVEERVRISRVGGVADVRMVRSDKLNAIDRAMFTALMEAGVALSRDPKLRAVVLSGEGAAFCSGLDIPSLMAGRDPGPSLITRTGDSPANLAQRCAWVWQEVPVPVIAAVHGVAYGGGFQIAMGADIRFVAPDARLSLREVHWGLIPDVAVTQTLRHVVRHDIAKELTFTARVVSGSEAVALGLATHVSEAPHADAMALAQEIAARSPDAVRAAKALWNQALDGSVEEGLRLEEKLQRTLMGRPNQTEAVQANLAKRAPKFSDPE
jgi:enoyl-CoA hydratase/carnithine racemase